MTQKHKEFGLSPNLHTRPATVPCKRCAKCGTCQAVERVIGLRTDPANNVAGLFCAYCGSPATAVSE